MPSMVEGDDLGAGLAGEDAEDGVERADPAQGAVAPAHGLRPGEGADGVLDGLGDDLGGGAAGRSMTATRMSPFLSGRVSSSVAGEAGGAEEAVDGLGGGVGARALALLAEVGRAVGEAGEGEGQAAGRGEGGGVGVGEAALDEAVGDEAAQVLGRLSAASGRGFPRRRVRAGGRASRGLSVARGWETGSGAGGQGGMLRPAYQLRMIGSATALRQMHPAMP